MSDDVKQNLKNQSTWMRGLYMLIYIFFSRIAELVLGVIILFQFLLKLFTGETNERLLKLGQRISTYVYQTLQFLSFNSEYLPYPFGAWPKGEPRPATLEDQGESKNA
jgi:hypothetical protein